MQNCRAILLKDRLLKKKKFLHLKVETLWFDRIFGYLRIDSKKGLVNGKLKAAFPPTYFPREILKHILHEKPILQLILSKGVPE